MKFRGMISKLSIKKKKLSKKRSFAEMVFIKKKRKKKKQQSNQSLRFGALICWFPFLT